MYYLSIGLTIAANVLYHVFQKATSDKVNPFISLIVTYAVALMVSILLFPLFSKGEKIIESVTQLNWASFALGFAIIGLELGFLLAYRAGWNINIAAIFSNASVTILLVPLGLIFFKEKLSIINISGIIVCIIGLLMINSK